MPLKTNNLLRSLLLCIVFYNFEDDGMVQKVSSKWSMSA